MERVYDESWRHTVMIVYCRSTFATKEGVELILKSGFPASLLTKETNLYGENCNALDRALLSKNVEVISYLLSDPDRKALLLKESKRDYVQQLIAHHSNVN